MVEFSLKTNEYHAFFFGLTNPVLAQICISQESERTKVELGEQLVNQQCFWFGRHHSLFEAGRDLALMCGADQ